MTIGPAGDSSFLRKLETTIREELAEAEATPPEEEVEALPIDQWQFDPEDAQRYEVGLRDLLGAVETLEDGSGRAGEVTVAEDRTVVVYAAASTAELDQARDLFRAFVTWHRQRHLADQSLIDRYFGTTGFERELAGLPGPYAPPAGRLLLAGSGDTAVGCAALRRIDDRSCEMKRMFVTPGAQGRGAGRALGTELIRAARAQGYASMYLDTSTRQTEALALYRSLGFTEIGPYYELPKELSDWLIFMRLDL